MKTIAKSLIVLTALVGATAAVAAGDQFRDRAQLKDGSCLALAADGTVIGCPRLADQDQIRDQLKPRDGSCLTSDRVPARDGTGLKAKSRTRVTAGHGKRAGGRGAF